MAGLLEARPEKSTREFACGRGPDMKQRCHPLVPIQNQDAPKCIEETSCKSWQARKVRSAKVLIQRSFFRAQWFDLSLFHISYFLSASLATGLLLGWHAVPLAEQQRKIQDQDSFDYGVPCRGSMDARLWHRKRAATSASSIDRSDRRTGDRVFGAWRSNGLHGNCNKHNRHCRQLERQRCARSQHDAGNNHIRSPLHRACPPSFSRHSQITATSHPYPQPSA